MGKSRRLNSRGARLKAKMDERSYSEGRATHRDVPVLKVNRCLMCFCSTRVEAISCLVARSE